MLGVFPEMLGFPVGIRRVTWRPVGSMLALDQISALRQKLTYSSRAMRAPDSPGQITLGKGTPPPGNGTPNKKHDDGPNGRANQTSPLACAIPAESLP
jgi:hypothetical protein